MTVVVVVVVPVVVVVAAVVVVVVVVSLVVVEGVGHGGGERGERRGRPGVDLFSDKDNSGSCRCALIGVPCRLSMLSTFSTFANVLF